MPVVRCEFLEDINDCDSLRHGINNLPRNVEGALLPSQTAVARLLVSRAGETYEVSSLGVGERLQLRCCTRPS